MGYDEMGTGIDASAGIGARASKCRAIDPTRSVRILRKSDIISRVIWLRARRALSSILLAAVPASVRLLLASGAVLISNQHRIASHHRSCARLKALAAC